MNLEETAQAIGLSKGWACRLRNRFIAGKLVGDKGKSVRGGRRREHFTRDHEAKLLKPFLESASTGGILVVSQIKPQLEAALGREMALTSVYNLPAPAASPIIENCGVLSGLPSDYRSISSMAVTDSFAWLDRHDVEP